MTFRGLAIILASGVSAVCMSSIVHAQGLTVPTNASAQTNGLPYAWPTGATVNLYVDTTVYPQGGIAWNAIVAGFASTSSAFTSYNVSFNIVPVAGCPTNPQGYFQTVTEAVMTDGDYGLTISYMGPVSTNGNYQTVAYATTTLASSITYYTDFLQGTSAHESSHNFGEDDCPDCDANDTPMSYKGTPRNPGAISPTAFDVQTANYAFSGSDGSNPGEGNCNDDEPDDCATEPPPQ